MPFLGTRKEEVGEKFRHYVTSTVCDEMKQNEIRNASAETNLSQLSPAGNRRVVKNVKQLNAAVTQRFPVDDECTGAHVNRLNGNFTQKSSATNDRREVNDMSLSAVFGLHSPTVSANFSYFNMKIDVLYKSKSEKQKGRLLFVWRGNNKNYL